MICASIRSEADAIYRAPDNSVSHWGYSVCGKLSLIISDSHSHRRISDTEGVYNKIYSIMRRTERSAWFLFWVKPVLETFYESFLSVIQ